MKLRRTNFCLLEGDEIMVLRCDIFSFLVFGSLRVKSLNIYSVQVKQQNDSLAAAPPASSPSAHWGEELTSRNRVCVWGKLVGETRLSEHKGSQLTELLNPFLFPLKTGTQQTLRRIKHENIFYSDFFFPIQKSTMSQQRVLGDEEHSWGSTLQKAICRGPFKQFQATAWQLGLAEKAKSSPVCGFCFMCWPRVLSPSGSCWLCPFTSLTIYICKIYI